MSNYNAQEVIAKLKANGGMYIDDHKRGEPTLVRADWFGIYKENEKEYAFVGYNRLPFCINKCYIDEQGQVHVSTWSVGGNVHMHDFQDFEDKVDRAVHDYNFRAKNNILKLDISISEFHKNAEAA